MDFKILMPEALCELVERLEKAGFSAYLVGGCVRDSLLGVSPDDYDIATSARPEEVMELFSDFKVIPTGIKHGTVTVIYKGFNAEVTTFRKDGEYTDCRHPENVEFSASIEEDTARRDFTVNALCYSPKKGLADFHGGVSDLENGILRCVGVPSQRFKEDALRILRALRFASRLGFEIENSTAEAMFSCKELINRISAERILAELKGFFLSDRSDTFVKDYFSVLAAAVGTVHTIDTDALQSALSYIRPSNRLSVFFAVCGGSVDGAVKLIRRLKPDNLTVKAVLSAATAYYGNCFNDGVGVAKTVRQYGADSARMMYELSMFLKKPMCYDALQRIEMIEKGILPLSLKELAVGGNDLSQSKIAFGKDIGTVLEHLYLCVHCGTENTKKALLLEAESYMNTIKAERKYK